jgi:hypothetical protein
MLKKERKNMKFLLLPGNSIDDFRFWKYFNADCIRAFAVAGLIAGVCQSPSAAAASGGDVPAALAPEKNAQR